MQYEIPLVAHIFDSLPWWPDEDNASFCTLLCKCRVLAQLKYYQQFSPKSLRSEERPSNLPHRSAGESTHKSITGVNSPTPLPLRNLDNPIPIQVRRHRAQIIRKRRAQSMLSPTIRISIQRRHANAMLRRRPSNTTKNRTISQVAHK